LQHKVQNPKHKAQSTKYKDRRTKSKAQTRECLNINNSTRLAINTRFDDAGECAL